MQTKELKELGIWFKMNEAQVRQLRILIQDVRYKLDAIESKIQSYEVE